MCLQAKKKNLLPLSEQIKSYFIILLPSAAALRNFFFNHLFFLFIILQYPYKGLHPSNKATYKQLIHAPILIK